MEEQKLTVGSFPDHQQNYWHLASIQISSLGIPSILIGGQIANKIGIPSAITSIIIGNLILWMIGFTIISMASPNKDNAIQNVQRFLGKFGGIFAAIFLIIAFLSWYILQINSSVAAIRNIIQFEGSTLRLGAVLGFFTALLSIGGIRLIKHFCVFSFPALVVSGILILLLSSYRAHFTSLGTASVMGTITITSINLPGMVNLPTFFRHSKSKADSYLALSLIVLFNMLFQIFSIATGYFDASAIQGTGILDQGLLIIFILLTLISVNLVNIYFASAGWEMILPHRRSVKEYVIVGLMGTLAFTFLQISKPMSFLEEMADNFIASLGIVLLLAFLMKIIVKHRTRTNEQWMNVFCWFCGGALATVMQTVGPNEPSHILVTAIGTSALLFLVIIFLEETNWAIRKLLARRK
jgi:purine-cytosine permease-like protein